MAGCARADLRTHPRVYSLTADARTVPPSLLGRWAGSVLARQCRRSRMEADAPFEDQALGFLFDACTAGPRGPASIVHARTRMPYAHTPGGDTVNLRVCKYVRLLTVPSAGRSFARTTSLGGRGQGDWTASVRVYGARELCARPRAA